MTLKCMCLVVGKYQCIRYIVMQSKIGGRLVHLGTFNLLKLAPMGVLLTSRVRTGLNTVTRPQNDTRANFSEG